MWLLPVAAGLLDSTTSPYSQDQVPEEVGPHDSHWNCNWKWWRPPKVRRTVSIVSFWNLFFCDLQSSFVNVGRAHHSDVKMFIGFVYFVLRQKSLIKPVVADANLTGRPELSGATSVLSPWWDIRCFLLKEMINEILVIVDIWLIVIRCWLLLFIIIIRCWLL